MGRKKLTLTIKESHFNFDKKEQEDSLRNLRELIATVMFEYAKKNKH